MATAGPTRGELVTTQPPRRIGPSAKQKPYNAVPLDTGASLQVERTGRKRRRVFTIREGPPFTKTFDGVPYTVSRHWTSLRESAEFPTSVKGVVTLLGKSRWAISNARRVRVSRGMSAVLRAFKRRM
jgi:hypothetical protein